MSKTGEYPATQLNGTEELTVKQVTDGAPATKRVTVAQVRAGQPDDLRVFVPGKPAAGARIFMHYFKRAVRIEVEGSGLEIIGKAIVPETADPDPYIRLFKNAIEVGTLWAVDGGVISSEEGFDLTFAPGDVLQIFAPDPQDATLADFCFTLPGVLL